MYQYKKKALPKNTYELLVSIPKKDIEKAYKEAFKFLSRQLSLPGFRKGKIPLGVAKKHIKDKAVIEQILKTYIPKIYQEILKKEGLKPIVSPKIEVLKFKKDQPWKIKILLAEEPVVEIGDYRSLIEEIKSEQKKEDIWVPGKDKNQSSQKDEQLKQKLLNKILTQLLKQSKVDIADLIIEEELNRRLSQLVDDVQKAGLTMDNYLKSKKLSITEIKERYKKEIEETYKLEFILMKIGDKEKITVEQKDLEEIFSKIKDPNQQKQARKNSYLYASIIRKQKILDYLLSL